MICKRYVTVTQEFQIAYTKCRQWFCHCRSGLWVDRWGSRCHWEASLPWPMLKARSCCCPHPPTSPRTQKQQGTMAHEHQLAHSPSKPLLNQDCTHKLLLVVLLSSNHSWPPVSSPLPILMRDKPQNHLPSFGCQSCKIINIIDINPITPFFLMSYSWKTCFHFLLACWWTCYNINHISEVKLNPKLTCSKSALV